MRELREERGILMVEWMVQEGFMEEVAMCPPEKGERKDWGRRKAGQHVGKGRTRVGKGSQADWSVSVTWAETWLGSRGGARLGSAGNDSLRSQSPVGSGKLLNMLGLRITCSMNKHLSK